MVLVVAVWAITSLWKDYARSRESERWERRLQHEALATAGWRERAAAFEAEMKRLRADSTKLYADWRAADSAADSAMAALQPLLALIADTAARRRAAEAAATLRQPAASCSLVVINCEARARAAEVAQIDAKHRADSLAAALDTTGTKWRDAERRADRRLFLGAGAGYGAVLSGGRLYTGPGAHVGVEYRFSLKDLFHLVF